MATLPKIKSKKNSSIPKMESNNLRVRQNIPISKPQKMKQKLSLDLTYKSSFPDIVNQSSKISTFHQKSYSTRQITISNKVSPVQKPRIIINSEKIDRKGSLINLIPRSNQNSIQQSAKRMKAKEINQQKPLKKLTIKDYLIPQPEKSTKRSQKSIPKSFIQANFSISCDDSSSYLLISDISSDSDSENLYKSESVLRKEVLNSLLIEYLSNEIPAIISLSQSELISAYLSLSSSKILFKLIDEIVDLITPKLVQLAYDEESEAVYTGVRDMMLQQIILDELNFLACDFNLIQISLEIMKDYAKLLPIEEIVKESIAEEELWAKKFIEGVYDDSIDLLMDGEWLELLIEDEIIKHRIEEIWNLFPNNLAKDITQNKQSNFIDRLSEYIWYGILNEDVSTLWLSTIIQDVLSEQDTFETLKLTQRSKIRSNTYNSIYLFQH